MVGFIGLVHHPIRSPIVPLVKMSIVLRATSRATYILFNTEEHIDFILLEAKVNSERCF